MKVVCVRNADLPQMLGELGEWLITVIDQKYDVRVTSGCAPFWN